MHRLVIRTILIITVAAGAVIGLALPASAATTAATMRPHPPWELYSTTTAGWSTGGTLTHGPQYWRFRYVAATVTIPTCQGNPTIDNVEATVGLQGFSENPYGASIGVSCAPSGGVAKAHYGWNLPSGSGDLQFPAELQLHVGDSARMELYFRHGDGVTNPRLEFTITKKDPVDQTEFRVVKTVRIPPDQISQVFFRHAGFNSFIDPNAPLSPVPGGTVLWQYRDCKVTNDPTSDHPGLLYRGRIFGPWQTSWATVTRDASSDPKSQVVLFPSWPFPWLRSDSNPTGFDMVWHEAGF